MTGISESLDLDIGPALAQVAKLEAAVTKVGKVNVPVATPGAEKAAAEIGGFEKVVANARAGVLNLAKDTTGTLGPSLNHVGGIFSEISTAASAVPGVLLGVAAGAVAAGLALGAMAIKGVGEFTSLAGEIRTVQRASGATAEESSKLVAAFRATGIEATAGAAAFFKFSRNIEAHEKTLEADGVQIVRNKTGQIDLTATLLNVSDAYRKAGQGAEGNRILFDAFGRSGLALVPILAAGRETLNGFFDAAARHHEILTQQDLDSAREYKLAVHDLGESFTGLERELGGLVVPVLTKTASALTKGIEAADGAAQHLGGFGNIAKHVTGLIPGLNVVVGALSLKHHEAADASKRLTDENAKSAAALQTLAAQTGVTLPRLQALAAELGIDLPSANEKEIAKLRETAEKLNAAVTPTQRLAADTKILGTAFSTTSETMKAYKDALDATLGAALSTDEAHIKVRDGVRKLTEEIGKGRQAHEDLATFQDRTALSAINLVRDIEAEGETMAKNGLVAADSATQQGFLRERLKQVADAVPAVRDQILLYISTLDAIPTAEHTTITVDATQAINELSRLAIAQAQAAGNADYANELAQVGPQPASQDLLHRLQDQAAAAGAEAARRFANAVNAPSSIGQAAAAGSALGEAAAEKAAKAVETTLRRSAQPGQGLDLGGFIVTGIELGAKENEVRAKNAALALITGMADVVNNAQVIDPTEAAGILEAVKAADEAAKQLDETRTKLGADSIEAAVAEGKLAQAQADVGTKTLDAIDATKAVTEALKKQKDAEENARNAVDSYNRSIRDGLDGLLGSLSATRGLADAQRALSDAQGEVASLGKRQAQLPKEIAAADQALAAAKSAAAQVTTQEALAIVRARQNVSQAQAKLTKTEADGAASADDLQQATLELADAKDQLNAVTKASVGPTQDVADAERHLNDLIDEQTQIAKRLADAQNRVTDAQFGVIDAQKRLLDSSEKLNGATDKSIELFRALGQAAGLTAGQIDSMVQALAGAQSQATRPLAGNPLVPLPNVSQPFLNTVTGRPAFTGPHGEAGASLGEIQAFASAHGIDPSTVQTWVQPGGASVSFIPGQFVDVGNLGALGGLQQQQANVPVVAPSTVSMQPLRGGDTIWNVSFQPQQATFNERDATGAIQNMALLYP